MRAAALEGNHLPAAVAKSSGNSDVQCLGEQSWEERDLELRADAVDIDSEDEPIGGGRAASQPQWGSQLEGSQPLELSESDE